MSYLAVKFRKFMKAIPYYLYLIVICSLSSGQQRGGDLGHVPGELSDQPVITEAVSEYGISLEDYEEKEGKVRSGDYFSTLLQRLGLSYKEAYAVSEACKGIFDVTKFKIGNSYHAYYPKTAPNRPDYLVYEQDSKSYVLFGLQDSLFVQVHEKQMQVQQAYADVTIRSSLWNDCVQAGVTPLLAIRLSEIYAWTIDFFAVQPGDSFRAVYELVTYQGEVLDVNRVLYAEFVHNKSSHKCYWFEEEEGGNVYWNEKGESLRKAFLKAPLNFTRISSGFSYNRRHPVTRRVQAHTGIDYAAPTGTPVMSIGDGVVVYRAYSGAGGNMVKIKHNSVYTSAYLHLSRYAKGLKVGDRVRQGEVIGYVGSTGRSTGPHLDFRVWKNGTPINPLRMESPPTNPVQEQNREQFETAKKEADQAVVTLLAADYLKRSIQQLVSRCCDPEGQPS